MPRPEGRGGSAKFDGPRVVVRGSIRAVLVWARGRVWPAPFCSGVRLQGFCAHSRIGRTVARRGGVVHAGDLMRRHACRVSLLSCILVINPLPHPKHRYCTYWPYPGTMRSPRSSPGDPHREHTASRSSNRRPHPQHRRMRRTVCAPEPAVVMSSIWFRHPQKGHGGDASPPVPPAPPDGYGVFRVLSNTRTHRSPGLRRVCSAPGWWYPVPFAPAGGFPAGTGRPACSVSYIVMGAPTF